MKSIFSISYVTLLLIAYSCKEDKPAQAVITTNAVSDITATSAKSGGAISSDGGALIISSGVCWSLTVEPTTYNPKTSDLAVAGNFSSNITNLEGGKTYYIRAYATNSAGTSYGNQISFKTLTLPPQKITGIKILPGNYNMTISWDPVSNKQYKSLKVYRDTITSPSILYKEIAYTNQFTDLLVSLNKKYYYKISVVDNNNLESEKSDEVSGIPMEPVNTAIPVDGEIGGIHYAFWDFSSPTFTKLVHNFSVFNEPTNKDNSLNKDGLYYQFYQGLINDTIGFYYGIQTSVMKPNGDNKKGVIFSRWKTRDTSNYKIAQGGWGQSAGYEGDFIGVRKNYEWGLGTYSIELRKDSSDVKGDWYGLWIRKLPASVNEYIGSIRFEKSSKSSGIKNGGITWTELYFKANANTPLPRWHLSVNEALADNKKALHVTSAYNSDKFVGFTNIFTTNANDVQFLMGPTVKRFHSAGLLW